MRGACLIVIGMAVGSYSVSLARVGEYSAFGVFGISALLMVGGVVIFSKDIL